MNTMNTIDMFDYLTSSEVGASRRLLNKVCYRLVAQALKWKLTNGFSSKESTTEVGWWGFSNGSSEGIVLKRRKGS